MWTDDVYSSFRYLISPGRLSKHVMIMYKYINFTGSFVYQKQISAAISVMMALYACVFCGCRGALATRSYAWIQSQQTVTNTTKIAALNDVFTVITSPLPQP